ncbi:MAG: YbaK/EbsC family protein [Pseudomonadota bacterium]
MASNENRSVSLGKRARQFQRYLDEQGFAFAVQELPASTRTAQDAAAAVNCEIGQIVKSLVFKNQETGEPVVVLASGPNRVDENKLGSLASGPVKMADPAFVRSATGFSIGGVPPFGHKTAYKLVVDEDLFQYPEIWAAAGTPNAVFKITGDLAKILPPHVVGEVS